jgi:hypothetical protein
MYYGGAESWKLRDTHMFETLQHLLDAKGPMSKAIVRAHNSVIGDAGRTSMGANSGELNVRQLCRHNFGRDAALIGFGTHTGRVAAAQDWDGEMEIMRVNPSHSPTATNTYSMKATMVGFCSTCRPGATKRCGDILVSRVWSASLGLSTGLIQNGGATTPKLFFLNSLMLGFGLTRQKRERLLARASSWNAANLSIG